MGGLYYGEEPAHIINGKYMGTQFDFETLNEIKKHSPKKLLVCADGCAIRNQTVMIDNQKSLGASRNLKDAYNWGKLLGMQMNDKGVDWILGPSIDMCFDPLMYLMAIGNDPKVIAELARLKGESDALYVKLYNEQKELVNTIAWDGEWFIRCITDDGRFIGSDKESQAKVWLNSQTWAVLSGLGDKEKQIKAMDSVRKYLNTEIGIKKIHPSMKDYPSKEDPLTYDKPGCSENGSIFCHANTWAIIAECMLGRAENAYEYYHQLLPMIAQKKVGEWRYKAEPYVYSSNIFGPESDKFGLANVSWLSGTASWMYIAATQYMLGIRPKFDGLQISPCLSKEMLPCKVTRVFRGTKYEITITSNNEVFIPYEEGKDVVKVTV